MKASGLGQGGWSSLQSEPWVGGFASFSARSRLSNCGQILFLNGCFQYFFLKSAICYRFFFFFPVAIDVLYLVKKIIIYYYFAKLKESMTVEMYHILFSAPTKMTK